MSGQFTGMNIAQVRELAQMFKQKSDDIQQLATQITAKLGGTEWVGPDRQNFEQEWNQAKTQLKSASDTLEREGQKAMTNAQEQETASSK